MTLKDPIANENLRRLINFSDAIVAVAITILVIPLTDLFQDLSNTDLTSVFSSVDFQSRITNFLISFFVIYAFWNRHAAIFADKTEISVTVAKLNRLWLLTIVLIPSTTMINLDLTNNVGVYIYGGMLILSMSILMIIKAKVSPESKKRVNTTLLLLLICLIVLAIFPTLGHNVYFLLLIEIPLNHFLPQYFD